MAGGIVINGRFVARPGIYSNVNYINIPGAPTQGTSLAVVGEFPFLQQHVPYLSTSQRDFEALAPQSALLKKLSSIIYNPLNEANLSGSPAAVYFISPVANTQAQAEIPVVGGGAGISVKAKQWGLMGNKTTLRLAVNATRGGWDAVIANNGTQENIRISGEAIPLSLDYENPESFDARPAAGAPLGPIVGFSRWITKVPSPSTTDWANEGNLTLAVGDSPVAAGSMRIGFSREIDPRYADETERVVWQPNGPVSGQLRVLGLPGIVLSAGAKLEVKVTGINAESGIEVTDTLEFEPADITTAQLTAVSFSSVDSVSLKLVGAGATLTDGYLRITGQCFDDFNAVNGQKFVSDVIRLLQPYSAKGFIASTQSSRVTSIQLVDLDKFPLTSFGATPATPALNLSVDGWKIVSTINTSSRLVVLERGNVRAPDVVAGTPFFTRLAGGTEPSLTDATDWSDALDQLVWYNIDVVSAFYDPTDTPAADDAVLAQFKEHIERMWSDGANERTLWLGAGVDESLQQLVQRAAAFNSERINVVVDSAYIQQPDGTTEVMEPYWYALMLAAADASLLGVETLTRARPRVLGVERAEGLQAQEDVNELIRAGLIVSTTPPGAPTRIEREVTTWTTDDNPARTEAICTRSVRASLKAMRAALDSLIRPGAGVLVLADVKSTVIAELERQARSTSPLITDYDSGSLRISEFADRYEIGYIITVRINKNFITLNVGVTVPVGTI